MDNSEITQQASEIIDNGLTFHEFRQNFWHRIRPYHFLRYALA